MMKKLRPYLFLLILLSVAALVSVAAGAVFIPPGIVLSILTGINGDWPEVYKIILVQLRLPHMILVGLTGAALAGSGAAYQGLFRNPLADPYLIGAASGAGLGAVLAMSLRETGVLPWLASVPAAAFLGALGTVGLVYVLAYTRNYASAVPLILAGVAVSSFATALTSFLMLRSQGDLHRALSWLLGGATLSGWEPVRAATPYILLGLTLLLTTGHLLNVLQFGEEQAAQLGLSVNRAKSLIILAASLATAAAVAFSGIIGFIGLTVPHLTRMRWGADYRHLLPLAMLGGASALLLADLIARLILAPQELPVGIITALVGGPFFLWVMHRSVQPV